MLKYLYRLRNRKGFTLVEVIIVLVIIAIMAAMLIPSLTGYIDKAKKSKYMLSAKNCMKAMQVELSEFYAEQKDMSKMEKINVNDLKANKDITLLNTQFAKEVLETADDDPYMLIFGMGGYGKYNDSDRSKVYTIYFVIYWPDKNTDPIFFDGSQWTEKYPWRQNGKKDGQNTFEVNGENVLLQYYFIKAPSTNLTTNWKSIQKYLGV